MRKVSRNARAVVTGAGSGIGRALAVELARRGGRVVVSDVDETAAKRTVERITASGGEAISVGCDVRELDAVEWLAERSVEWFGHAPSLVINNAGVGAGGRLVGDMSLEDWDWVLDVNLRGPIHGCHVFTPLLREAGFGGIINVASAASFGAAPRMAAYNVSKAGVLSLSETMAAELSGSGVRVSVLCPTFVKTDIVANGRITSSATDAASRLMKVTGMSPGRVARTTLDTHDRGGLYVLPQLDAKVGWQLKRTAPRAYTKVAGLLERYGPLSSDDPADTTDTAHHLKES